MRFNDGYILVLAIWSAYCNKFSKFIAKIFKIYFIHRLLSLIIRRSYKKL